MGYWLLPRGVTGYPFVVTSKEKLQLISFLIYRYIQSSNSFCIKPLMCTKWSCANGLIRIRIIVVS